MFGKIGAMIFALGVMCADSVDILIPIMMVFAGMLLVAVDELRGSRNERR